MFYTNTRKWILIISIATNYKLSNICHMGLKQTTIYHRSNEVIFIHCSVPAHHNRPNVRPGSVAQHHGDHRRGTDHRYVNSGHYGHRPRLHSHVRIRPGRWSFTSSKATRLRSGMSAAQLRPYNSR